MFQDLESNIVKFVNSRELVNPEEKPVLLYDSLKEEYTNYYSSQEFIDLLREYLEASFKGYKFTIDMPYGIEYVKRNDTNIKYGKEEYNVGQYRISIIEVNNGNEKIINTSDYSIPYVAKFNEDLTYGNSAIPLKLELPNGILKINKKYEIHLKRLSISLLTSSGKLNTDVLDNLLVIALWKKAKVNKEMQEERYIRMHFKKITGREMSQQKMLDTYVTQIKKIKDYISQYDISVDEFILNHFETFFEISKSGKTGVIDFINKAIKRILETTIKNGETEDYFEVKQVVEDENGVIISSGTALNERLFILLSKYGTPENMQESIKTGILSKDIMVRERLFHDELEDKYILIKSGKDTTKYIAKYSPLSVLRTTQITQDDLICIISYLYNGMISLIDDVDKEFKKTVTSATDVINDIIRNTTRQKMFDTNTMDVDAIKNNPNNARAPISKQISNLISVIKSSDIIEYIDTNSVIKELANPLRVTLKASHVSDNARVIALKQFGILSPYTTPASQKIGITRSLSKYARKIDGVFKIPLYNVNNRVIDTSKIEYLTVEEYTLKKVAFVSTFDHINNKITSDVVQATVRIRDRFTIQNISADDIEYVTVSSDSILTFVESLIPFMSNDDGARILYAASMILQSVSLQSNEIPYVMTEEYIDSPKRYEYMFKKADKDYFVDIQTRGGDITLIGSGNEYSRVEMNPKFLAKFPLTKRSYVLNEDNIVEGDIIYDTVQSKKGILSVGKNLLVGFMPLDGWNGDDAYVVSEACKAKLSSINIFTEIIRGKNTELMSGRMQTPDTFKNLKRHSFLIETKELTNNRSTIPMVETEFQFINIDTFNKGDKVVGRHGNKGVNSIIMKNTQVPCLKNNIPLDIVFNQLGLGSRMNYGTVYDTKLGFVGWLLNIRFISNPILGCTMEELLLLCKYIYELSNANTAEEVNEKYAGKLTPKIMNAAVKRFKFIKMFEGVLTESCDAYVKLSYEDGRVVMKPITIGVQYVLKLTHIADHKAKVSKFDDKLAMHTLQPVNGQREGEMELDCLMAKGCKNMLRETLNFKSDNLRIQKERFTRSRGKGITSFDENDVPYATSVLKSILNTINIDLQQEQ